MPEVYLITGNLTVSGNTNLISEAIIPSGFSSYSFLPFNPNTNNSTFEPRYLLSNGTESTLPFAFGGPQPWPYATGVLIRFGFYNYNINQLPRWINTMQWLQVTGASLSSMRTGTSYINHSTGQAFRLPWTSFNNVPGSFFIRTIGRTYNIDQRLDHIENSGAFALNANDKIGFGTFTPNEKIDINGNLKVDETGFFQKIFIDNQEFTTANQFNPISQSQIEYNPVIGIIYEGVI